MATTETAVRFKNFTDTDFTWKFDGIPHEFKAGMEIFLESGKAEHFTKHLVDREMNRLNLITSNVRERARLTAMCYPTDEAVTLSEALQINEKAKVKKPKKVEVEFPDLAAKKKK